MQQHNGVILATNTKSTNVTMKDISFLGGYVDGRGGALVVNGVAQLILDKVIITRWRSLAAPALSISQVHNLTIIDSRIHGNRGDGQLIFDYVTNLNITDSSVIQCNTIEICVAVDSDGSHDYAPWLSWPDDTTWRCPAGSPFEWLTSGEHQRGSCMPCPLGFYDVALLVEYFNLTDQATGYDLAGIRPTCQRCTGVIRCEVNGNITIPRGWHAVVRRQQIGGRASLNVVAELPPPGWGCANEEVCAYHASCASGRDSTVPFCGACIDGYSEAFGTAECIKSSICGDSRSVGVVLVGLLIALAFVIGKSARPLRATTGIIDALLFFVQMVDIVLPSQSSTLLIARVFAALDLQFSATSGATGVCLWSIDAVDKVIFLLLLLHSLLLS
jgi:hypothetical protein